MANSVRFLKNIVLKVDCDGAEMDMPFAAGEIWPATRIEQDTDGFNDIHMPDGSIIKGVSSKVFSNMGNRVPVIQVENVEPQPSTEIEVNAPDEGPALLDGTMLSNSED